MQDVLAQRPAWYVVGAALGLCVVGLLVTLNARLGVLGGYSELVERLGQRSLAFGWRAWFLFGILGGGLLFGLLGGAGPAEEGYGWLTRTFEGGSRFLVGVLLLAAGALIGFGAKTAGGCTSGNGLAGSSLASPSSFVATATFMGTAVAASFVIKGLI